ncbi:hypothetical protein OUZ56_027269 [Daphnia magna]|uniref:Uncharacterized protein n=1 Tax=Daphnia magna TaxID=35525 RepID=A0ABQ9ZPD2_9CRUS|nr:hypothetical protein OUZ56_027269 [Daphnia magna]
MMKETEKRDEEEEKNARREEEERQFLGWTVCWNAVSFLTKQPRRYQVYLQDSQTLNNSDKPLGKGEIRPQ